MLTHRSHLVAIVVGGLYNPFYSAVLEQFAIKLPEIGLQPLLVHVDSGDSLDGALPRLASYRVDAVVSALAIRSARSAGQAGAAGHPGDRLQHHLPQCLGLVGLRGQRAGRPDHREPVPRSRWSPLRLHRRGQVQCRQRGTAEGLSQRPARTWHPGGRRRARRLPLRGRRGGGGGAVPRQDGAGRDLLRQRPNRHGCWWTPCVTAWVARSRRTCSSPGSTTSPPRHGTPTSLTTFVQDSVGMVDQAVALLQAATASSAPFGGRRAVLPSRLVERGTTARDGGERPA